MLTLSGIILFCREVWDDAGVVTGATEISASRLQEQFSVPVTNIAHHPFQSFQCRPNGELWNETSVQQSFNPVSASLPSSLSSSVIRQADPSAGLLAQLQQLVESYRVPDQASLDLMNWFSQEMLNSSNPHTLGLPSQQLLKRTDSVHMSSADSSTSERHTYSTLNNSGILQAASAMAAQLPATLCGRDTFNPVAAATTDRQYVMGELQPPLPFTDSVYQLSLLTHLQQMYLESAVSALHNLYVLQQQVIPVANTTVDSDSTPSSNSATVRTSADAVLSQSSDYVPHSD